MKQSQCIDFLLCLLDVFVCFWEKKEQLLLFVVTAFVIVGITRNQSVLDGCFLICFCYHQPSDWLLAGCHCNRSAWLLNDLITLYACVCYISDRMNTVISSAPCRGATRVETAFIKVQTVSSSEIV